GEAIYCAPATPRHGRPHTTGALPLSTDPAVNDIGTDVGHALGEHTLRAPDLSVGDFGEAEGSWATKAPPLAIEYAAQGQDEADLQLKIRQLLEAGTRFVWVVRLVGPRRVEVYEKGRPVRTKLPGERLEAPGVLKSRPLVEVLYDREASFEQTLLNLLERKGYANLDAVLAEGERKGEAKGLRAAVLDACEFLGIAPTEAQRAQLTSFKRCVASSSKPGAGLLDLPIRASPD
ncbi:MAG: Uma2 family endonuclease, partial [Polyangiaceae bacterium]|nr:Uma2 family endonuclease [Polyangiaceae bacterium]